jgi:SHS2 domain-containing protein
MDKFRYFDHTSEMKYQAYGSTMEEAFSNAALAMTHFVTPVDAVKVKSYKKVHITASSKESLLYDFLDEVLFLMDTIHFLTAEATVKITRKEGHQKRKVGEDDDLEGDRGKSEGEYELVARLGGDDEDVYPLKGEVKAITYNDMKITEEKGKWTVQVVCDI